jgi:chorismate mutase
MSPNKSLNPQSWLSKNGNPFIISGPCSAETEEQVLITAQKIAESGRVNALRAGIWKPRTRPNSFEGMGIVALPWLKKAASETGLLAITEVAKPQHVEQCLKEGIDMLWIGARTTANPFSVQEIAEALKGVDIPVFVKNPIHLDLQLWIGAMERLWHAGISRLGAIHRGFAVGKPNRFRNQPLWEIPIELKRLYPELPLLSDPSHISGNRDNIERLSQRALDLDFDGLMIESHYQPDKALSDAAQQITPEQLGEILGRLKYRRSSSANQEFVHNLQTLRHEIDELDEELLHLLKKRIEIVDHIGEFKLKNNVTIFQLERWIEILKTRSNLAIELGINKEFIVEMMKTIHKESVRIQSELNKKSKEVEQS